MKNLSIIKKKIGAFTLVEVTLVALILGLLIPSIFSMYRFIIQSNREVQARQMSIQGGYEFFEKLNLMIQNYSIDYEEYFNRQMVGCVNNGGLLTGKDFVWNVGLSGYCSEFTAYGNNNSTGRKKGGTTLPSNMRDVYYCSSDMQQNSGTIVVMPNECGRHGSQQSYGQYEKLFTDVHEGVWGTAGNIVGTSDDEVKGYILTGGTNTGVDAVADPNHIQEIYLISHDGKDRLYFRRKLISQEGEFTRYRIQMLRLKGFDAGQKHNFSMTTNNDGVFDGVIDTWACDASMGYIGHGPSLSGAYEEYHLPSDVDDCWIDISKQSTNIILWNISVSPFGDSDLFRALPDRQINPSMKLLMVVGANGVAGDKGLSVGVANYRVPIETTINMKNFYREQ